MQRVAGLDNLVWMEMKPPLAAVRFRPCIPRDGESLKSSTRKLQKILLERGDAKGELRLIVLQRAIRTVRAEHELAVFAIERRRNVAISEMRVVEIAVHGRRSRMLHSLRMMRRLPRFDFRCMALTARLATDVSGQLGIRR